MLEEVVMSAEVIHWRRKGRMRLTLYSLG